MRVTVKGQRVGRAAERMLVAAALAAGALLGTAPGTAAGPLEDALRALEIEVLDGKPAPAFTLAPLNGGPMVSLEGLRGRPVVLYFWASW